MCSSRICEIARSPLIIPHRTQRIRVITFASGNGRQYLRRNCPKRTRRCPRLPRRRRGSWFQPDGYVAAIIEADIERYLADVGVTPFSVSTAVVTAQRLLWVNYGDPALIGGASASPQRFARPAAASIVRSVPSPTVRIPAAERLNSTQSGNSLRGAAQHWAGMLLLTRTDCKIDRIQWPSKSRF